MKSCINPICGSVYFSLFYNDRKVKDVLVNNLITQKGYNSLTKSVSGYNFLVKEVRFGSGVKEAEITDTSLQEPTFTFPVTKFEYFDEGIGIKMFFDIPQNSSMDGATVTEMGLFDDKGNMLSRVQLNEPLLKTSNLSITGHWDYFLGGLGSTKKLFKVSLERFRGALLHALFTDGYYKPGAQITAPVFYNLRELEIDHFENTEGEIVTFPYTVTNKDVVIVPIFRKRLREDNVNESDISQCYALRCTDPHYANFIDCENGTGISETRNCFLYIGSFTNLDNSINKNTNFLYANGVQVRLDKKRKAGGIQNLFHTSDLEVLLLNRAFFAEHYKTSNMSSYALSKTLFTTLDTNVDWSWTVSGYATGLTNLQINNNSLGGGLKANWLIYIVYCKQTASKLKNTQSDSFLSSSNILTFNITYIFVADGSVSLNEYNVVNTYLGTITNLSGHYRHIRSEKFGRFPAYLDTSDKLMSTVYTDNLSLLETLACFDLSNLSSIIETNINPPDVVIALDGVDAAGKMLGVRYYMQPEVSNENKMYFPMGALSSTEGYVNIWRNGGNEIYYNKVRKIFESFRGWGNEFVVLSCMVSRFSRSYLLQNYSIQDPYSHGKPSDYQDIGCYQNLALLEEYFGVKIMHGLTTEFRRWLEETRIEHGLNGNGFSDTDMSINASVGFCGLPAAAMLKEVPISPMRQIGKRLIVVDVAPTDVSSFDKPEDNPSSDYTDVKELLSVGTFLPALFTPEQLGTSYTANNVIQKYLNGYKVQKVKGEYNYYTNLVKINNPEILTHVQRPSQVYGRVTNSKFYFHEMPISFGDTDCIVTFLLGRDQNRVLGIYNSQNEYDEFNHSFEKL
jgi:hypothetical protein